MRLLSRYCLSLGSLLLLLGVAPFGRTAPKVSTDSRLVSLRLDPGTIVLDGPLAKQHLLVTGRYKDGSEADVTPQAHVKIAKPGLVRVNADGTLTPLADGSTEAIALVGTLKARVPLIVTHSHALAPVSLANDVLPLFTRIGCNQGSCHGQQNGQGGFKLSLRGWDAGFDYEQIVKADGGKRVNVKEPEKSTLLLKPLMVVPHGGGPRLTKGSPSYNLLLRWLKEGMTLPDDKAPHLAALTVSPAERILPRPGLQQRVLVMARYSDGSVRDVTDLARFQSQNDAVAGVDEHGQITAKQSGESAIMVSYDGEVRTANILVPYPVLSAAVPVAPKVAAKTYRKQIALKAVHTHDMVTPAVTAKVTSSTPVSYIDTLVARKLAQLRLLPSGRATDSEFLRRVYLDAIGTLPTPEETRAFLADRAPNKRATLIDRLLERPEYVDYRTLKLADLLRVNGQYLSEEGADVYYRWIRERVQKNVGYDQFVRELLTGRGSNFRSGAANYFRVATNPEELAETTAQSFLGVRIQCAKCHNHPFEKWKQQDYYGVAAFFARVGRKGGPEFGEDQVFVQHDGEAVNPRTKQTIPPKFLGGAAPQVDPDADRRAALADWLTAKENLDFARVAVNRIWADCFGKGIVDAVDDFRVSNPPSNAPLLDALARDFIAHQEDVKYITRVILNSETYQRSSVILPGNAKDERYFARAYPRRIPAEPLMDAIAQVTEKPDRFGQYPLGWRAIQVRDSKIGAYFLEVFGRPKREILCACERSVQPNLSQSLQLINSGNLNTKLTANDGRIAHLLKQFDALPPAIADRHIIEELYLWTLARYPMPTETQNMLAFIAKNKDRRKGFEDTLWALLNSEEFTFNK